MTDENGLVYMRARYYSPTFKRFINADVVAGSITNAITLNRYAYANGNPVSNVDPLGLSADEARGTQGTAISTDSSSSIDFNFNEWYTDDVSNAIHTILDIAGFIPGFGSIADALNAVVYAFEGDWLNAGMSAFAALPGIGDIAAGCKWATKFFKASSKIGRALESVSTILSKTDEMIAAMTSFGRIGDDLSVVAKNGDEFVEQVAKNLGESPSSKILRGNMTANEVATPDYKNAAHHIVAGKAKAAQESRDILAKFGIGINDASNGVFLSTVKGIGGAYHPALHTNKYYNNVNEMLRKATSKDDVIKTLNNISDSLMNGTFSY